jgi:protein SDA1
MYRKSKDKGVQMAARGLLSLYRDVGAQMLKKKDRGRDAALGLRAGERQGPRFGEVDGGGIEGLELLEQWREEQGIGSDEDEQAWKDWEAQSDDSESSGGWVNVESDGEEIDISDSEDEKPKKAPKADGLAQKDSDKENKTVRFAIDDDQAPGAVDRNTEPAEPEIALKREEARISNLATTRILTPADLSKLQELRTQAAITANMPSAKRRKLQQQAAIARHVDDEVTADHIEGLAKLGLKATKEEKIRMAKGDPDEKNDHRSTTARRVEKKASEGKSTTNKEKARKKNFLMTLGKAKHKGKRSLVEHRKILKAHVDRSRKGGRRGNK